jgi:hypothetical protein
MAGPTPLMAEVQLVAAVFELKLPKMVKIHFS